MSSAKGVLVAFLFLIIIIIGGTYLSKSYGIDFVPKTPTIILNNHKIQLIVVKSEKDKQQGLSVYNRLAQSKGMFFVFEKVDYHPFWMKDMKFPIDIIYLKDKTITTIYENVPIPKSNENLEIYKPKSPSDSVLEINAGLSKKFNLKVGDKISYENFSN